MDSTQQFPYLPVQGLPGMKRGQRRKSTQAWGEEREGVLRKALKVVGEDLGIPPQVPLVHKL